MTKTEKRYTEICENIWKCKECAFHKDLKSKNISFCPETPILTYREARRLKVFAIGINPGWTDEKDYGRKAAYSANNLKTYRRRMGTFWKIQKKKMDNRYNKYLRDVINALGVKKKKIREGEDISGHAFMANLSFCNSQSEKKRIFGGRKIRKFNLSNELKNCLEKQYLRELIDVIGPEYLLFLKSGSGQYLRSLGFPRSSDEACCFKKFETSPLRKRKNYGQAYMYNGTKIIVLPHASSFYPKYDQKRIEKICKMVKEMKAWFQSAHSR